MMFASMMPYKTSMQQIYDSGDFTKNLDDCLSLAGYGAAIERQRAAQGRGMLYGVGVATAVAASGGRDYEHAENPLRPVGRCR
jgi:hypothetical protein